jgi:hypothetical protein
MASVSDADEIVYKLRQYYKTNPAARLLLGYFARRQQGRVVTVDRLEQVKSDGDEKLAREEIIDVLKQLADWGLGEFRAGRRGHPSRFIWSASMSSVGEAAAGRGTIEDVVPQVEDGEEEIRTLQHPFRLRPDYVVTMNLPMDITLREATRLADFVKALPFEAEVA